MNKYALIVITITGIFMLICVYRDDVLHAIFTCVFDIFILMSVMFFELMNRMNQIILRLDKEKNK